MPKNPGIQSSLFIYKDIPEALVCPICARLVAVVIPAETLTYLVHTPEVICVMDNNPPMQEIVQAVKSG